MKIGIESAAYFRRFGVEKGAYIARDHGYDCLDFGDLSETETELFRLPEPEFEKRLVYIKNEMAKNGLYASQTHGPWRHPPRDYTEEDRAERFDAMSKGIRGTAYIGSENFVIHTMMPFGTGSGEQPELQKQINFEYFNRLCDVAEQYNITICFENLPFNHLPINNCKQILEFVKWVNRDCFKVCLDTGHALVSHEQPGEAVRMIGKEYLRTLHVHDNDGTGDYHKLPGDGIADWEDFGKALNEIGFDGALSLETMVRGKDLSLEEWDAQARALAATAKRISEYR